MNGFIRFAHELTDKVHRTMCSPLSGDVPADCRFSPPQGPAERLYHIFCLRVFPDMVTHDFSGAGIGDQTQMSRAAA